MQRSSYTVTSVRGCRAIDRPIPIDDLAALIAAWTKLEGVEGKWFCDGLLSERLGCALVVGPKSALNAWRADLGLAEMP